MDRNRITCEWQQWREKVRKKPQEIYSHKQQRLNLTNDLSNAWGMWRRADPHSTPDNDPREVGCQWRCETADRIQPILSALLMTSSSARELFAWMGITAEVQWFEVVAWKRDDQQYCHTVTSKLKSSQVVEISTFLQGSGFTWNLHSSTHDYLPANPLLVYQVIGPSSTDTLILWRISQSPKHRFNCFHSSFKY